MALARHGAPDACEPPARLRVDRFDGSYVVAHVHGRADAPPPALLILDGIGCSGWAFRRIIARLRDKRRIVLLHYPGHGDSRLPERPWRISMPTLADDAAAVLDRAGVEIATVVGFSMGFQVALELYRRHRERVVGLMSIGGPAGRCMAGLLGTGVFARGLPLAEVATRHAPGLCRTLWHGLVSSNLVRYVGVGTQVNADLLPVSDFDYYTARLAEMDPELFFAMLAEANRHTAVDILPHVCVPTVVVAGRGDTFVPLETMRDMAFRMPRARWVVVADATHALPAEHPGEVVRRIQSLLAEAEHPA
jgi:pimeloyl-ACP methyl ester carboxylesterase